MVTEGSMYYQVALHAVLLLQYQSQTCVVGHTRPLVGYRCNALSETNQITKLFSLEESTLACVRWNNCIVLNYNSDLRLCVLSSAHCTSNERSMAITIRAFHPRSERHRCVSWKSYTGMFSTAATGGVITHNPTYSQAVARGKLNSALLVTVCGIEPDMGSLWCYSPSSHWLKDIISRYFMQRGVGWLPSRSKSAATIWCHCGWAWRGWNSSLCRQWLVLCQWKYG